MYHPRKFVRSHLLNHAVPQLTYIWLLVAFLERLQTSPPLPSLLVDHLGTVYKFSTSPNAEIRFRFYQVALADPSSVAAKAFAVEAANWVVGKDGSGVIKGRMKFCRPVLRAVRKVDADLAKQVFEPSKYAFHPIASKMIEKVSFRGFYCVDNLRTDGFH